ncbi:hypothetical protein Tco_0090900 [Tanacetum coccineum]
MDSYSTACLEELADLMTLQVCEDSEDHARDAQEKVQEKRREAFEDVIQRIRHSNHYNKQFRAVMHESSQGDRVKFASSTLQDSALTWWNMYVRSVTLDAAHATPWNDFKAMFIRKRLTQYAYSVLTDHTIRRIHQLDTTYPTFLSGQRIEFYCLNGIFVFRQYGCMTRSSTQELLSPLENPERVLRSRRKLFDNPSLVDASSSESEQLSKIEDQVEEGVTEAMAETMEQYMSKTRENYGSGITRPTINQDTPFELKGKFLKELHDNTFSGSKHEDANEHIEKVLEIVDLFHILKVTQDQIMLRAFPVSLTGAASKWLRNQPSDSITTWEILKTKFLNKYCTPARTAKKMEEINNFQQEPDESLFRAWKRFKELLMKCPQHYLTDMQEVILFYNGLDVPTRQILDSKGAIPAKTAADAKIAIQEMAEYSQKWHNGTSSRTKVNEKVYTAQVGCEQCKGPHYTKDYPQKDEGNLLEEAYYTQFGTSYQPGGQYRATGPRFYQRNNGNSSYPTRRDTMEESLGKFMAESAKRHEENSNIIKEIKASTDTAIRNQGASIKSLELQIGQISRMEHYPYAVSIPQHRFSFPKTVPFPRRLHNKCCDDFKEAYRVNILDTHDSMMPPKEKDPGSFTLPCLINNNCFNKALVDLGASVSVMLFSTYTNLGLGELTHTRMTIELADRTIKQPIGITSNMLVRIGKFVFPIDFVVLDIPEDEDIPLILGRPFLSTAHVKIDVYKRKDTLRDLAVYETIFEVYVRHPTYREATSLPGTLPVKVLSLGLPLNIKGNVTSSKPVDLHEAIEMAQGLMYQRQQGCLQLGKILTLANYLTARSVDDTTVTHALLLVTTVEWQDIRSKTAEPYLVPQANEDLEAKEDKEVMSLVSDVAKRDITRTSVRIMEVKAMGIKFEATNNILRTIRGRIKETLRGITKHQQVIKKDAKHLEKYTAYVLKLL